MSTTRQKPHYTAILFIVAAFAVGGCRTGTPDKSRDAVRKNKATDNTSYPARPAIAPPAFKVFHHDSTSYTLATKPDATDDEIAAILWQLRDAAQGHSFDKLHISQKDVDARDPYLWFHLYRGSKCAAEKYASGPPPCGGSYHAAGDFTFGDFKKRERTSGLLIHDEAHETPLWDADPSSGK